MHHLHDDLLRQLEDFEFIFVVRRTRLLTGVEMAAIDRQARRICTGSLAGFSSKNSARSPVMPAAERSRLRRTNRRTEDHSYRYLPPGDVAVRL